MSKIIIDMPNAKLKDAAEKKLAKETEVKLKRRIGKKKKNELDGEVVRLRQTFRKINQRLF